MDFHRPAESQAMREGRRGGEPFRQQQHFIRRFAFGQFLNGAPFVKQTRRRTDDIFADALKQEMNRLRHAGVFRANGHHKRAGFLNNTMRTPVVVGLAMMHRRLRIEFMAHRFDTFLPGVVVQNEIAEARMAFKDQAKHVLGFALMPVGGVNEFDDAGKSFFSERRSDQNVNPARCGRAVLLRGLDDRQVVPTVVKDISQLPFARAFFNNQPCETEIPFQEKPPAQFGELHASACDFAPGMGWVYIATHIGRPAAFHLLF